MLIYLENKKVKDLAELIKKVEETENLTLVKSSLKKQPNGLDIGLFRNSTGKLISGRLLVGDCSKKLLCVGLSNQTKRRAAVKTLNF